MPTLKNNFLTTLRVTLLYTLIPSLFLSFYPIISLGSSDSMNFELSLPLIVLTIYDVVSFVAFLKDIKSFTNGFHSYHLLILLFPLYLTLSMFWSANPLRAFLTSVIAWVLLLAVFSTRELLQKSVVKITTLKKILYLSTIVACVFCWLQCLLDLIGVSRDYTLLCPGCTYRSFGFPHPNGFAVEPQFMGNLLLAPCLILLIDLFSISPRSSRKLSSYLLLVLFVATLFLTFSRGAIYSFVIAVAVFIVYALFRYKSARPLLSISLILIAFLFTLSAQGLMAATSPTSDTFVSGVTKSIHQLSLGKIDLRTPDHSNKPVENYDNSVENSAFSGYVAESTDTRLKLSDYALELWRKSPQNIFLGVGLGGAGTALAESYPDIFTPKEIIQNEYFSLLLETGLVGLTLLLLGAFIIIKFAHSFTYFPLFIAYVVSVGFFSGLPNALHIYLILLILGVV